MTWLTFRQFRAQAIAALAALAVLAVAYGTTGSHLVHLYNASGMRGCGNGPACLSRASTFIDAMKADQVYPALFFLGMAILVILPAIIGAFWGAPLVARELETGTYRLAWNQDVTRTRWIAVKLGGIGLAAIATSGLLSLLFSWWAGPINAAGGFPNNFSQFVRMTPLMFASQGVVPAAGRRWRSYSAWSRESWCAAPSRPWPSRSWSSRCCRSSGPTSSGRICARPTVRPRRSPQ